MGIPPAPRGVPQIEVTFEVYTSILYVSARQLGGSARKFRRDGHPNMTDIERMVKEAEAVAEQDKAAREV